MTRAPSRSSSAGSSSARSISCPASRRPSTQPIGFLVADKPDEPLDVRAAQLLVRPCEPGELAEIRVAAPAVPAGEHRQIVVMLREDALAEPLEGKARERSRQSLVALAEGAQ